MTRLARMILASTRNGRRKWPTLLILGVPDIDLVVGQEVRAQQAPASFTGGIAQQDIQVRPLGAGVENKFYPGASVDDSCDDDETPLALEGDHEPVGLRLRRILLRR